MILDDGETEANGADWSEFESAWKDERLRCDSRYELDGKMVGEVRIRQVLHY